ncbi:MAG: LOG family protein [Phycisphaerae bacterium]|nr:LOG family protein [Phycisphaerae bacterium]
MSKKRVVTIFGGGSAVEGDGVFEQAVELGFLLASRDCTIANGGYGGTMLAAARGAHKAGGDVIGVTCAAFRRAGPNEYVTQEIQTHSLEERLRTLVELGSAYFVLPGGTGTLLELAEVWELKNKRFASASKPIIIVGEFWKDLIGLMQKADPKSIRHITAAATPSQAVGLFDGSVPTTDRESGL